MTLTLTVVASEHPLLPVGTERVFDARGGSIGRLPESDLVLPDPHVSGRHAVLRYAGGVFYIEDTSRNGVSINGRDNTLQPGQPYALKTGDSIFIESFAFRAAIAEAPHAPSFADDDDLDDWLTMDAPGGRSGEVDPLALLGLTQSPPSSVPAPLAADATSGVFHEPYSPPVIAAAPVRGPVQEPRTDARRDRGDVAAAASRASRSTAPAVESISTEDAGLATLLSAAGIDGVAPAPELARTLGLILRVVVDGVMDVLRARQHTKEEFKLGVTRFRPADNNPLKFSANVDDALHNLLVKKNPAFLAPVEAFEDAFTDLRNHQVATLAGLRVAFDAMLAEFDPDRLERQFDAHGKGDALVSWPGRLRYWLRYRQKYEVIRHDADKSFRELFGERFAKAYAEQLQRLKAQPRESAGTLV